MSENLTPKPVPRPNGDNFSRFGMRATKSVWPIRVANHAVVMRSSIRVSAQVKCESTDLEVKEASTGWHGVYLHNRQPCTFGGVPKGRAVCPGAHRPRHDPA